MQAEIIKIDAENKPTEVNKHLKSLLLKTGINRRLFLLHVKNLNYLRNTPQGQRTTGEMNKT